MTPASEQVAAGPLSAITSDSDVKAEESITLEDIEQEVPSILIEKEHDA